MNKNAVVLLSGGLDSTTCLAVAKHQGYACHCLSFDYGQKQRAELSAARAIAANFGAMNHLILPIPIDEFTQSALTSPDILVPDYQAQQTEIPVTYVPARNTIFLAFALGWAEMLKAPAIFIGVSAIDYSGYPDCRPIFIEQFNKLAQLALKTGVENSIQTVVQTPLIHLNKADTIRLGLSLGVDYSLTVTCYRADSEGRACGHCDSCHYRKKGFREAGVSDPTRYTVIL